MESDCTKKDLSFIGSITVIPKVINGKFGDLYEIKSAANEIFVSAVTVEDIEVNWRKKHKLLSRKIFKYN